MNNNPVYPKDNGSLERARQAFYKKVRETRWDDTEECPYKRRGRKAKPIVRIESKPRSRGEELALKQSKYNWL